MSFELLNVTILGAKGPQNLVVGKCEREREMKRREEERKRVLPVPLFFFFLGIGISLGNKLVNVHIPPVTVAVDENVWSPGDAVKHPQRLAVISLADLNVRIEERGRE